jgi:hypothetical protein
MEYKIWIGLARTQAEFASMKPQWTARVRDSLHDALWDAMGVGALAPGEGRVPLTSLVLTP